MFLYQKDEKERKLDAKLGILVVSYLRVYCTSVAKGRKWIISILISAPNAARTKIFNVRCVYPVRVSYTSRYNVELRTIGQLGNPVTSYSCGYNK